MASATGPAAEPIAVNVGANLASAPPADSAVFICPTPSTRPPMPFTAPTVALDIPPITTAVFAPDMTARFVPSSRFPKPSARSPTHCAPLRISGSSTSPQLIAASTMSFFASCIWFAVVPYAVPASFASAVFSAYAVDDVVRQSVRRSYPFARAITTCWSCVFTMPRSFIACVRFSVVLRPFISPLNAPDGSVLHCCANSCAVVPAYFAYASSASPPELTAVSISSHVRPIAEPPS